MSRHCALKKSLTLSTAVAAILSMHTGYAADAPEKTSELETVVVTGSYIRGAAGQAALPVDVISNEDLEKQGSPSIVQLIKTITASTAAIGESNRYNVGAGTAQINLRGLGAQRTLTLMNGRRLADNPIAGGQNLNFIPTAAIARVEVLKEGSAATYGSDAIGGVVNFITRTDLQGLEVRGQYADIRGSNGDYEGSLAWGTKTSSGNVLLTAGFRHRSRLDVHERDWAVGHYDSAFFGGWTGNTSVGNYQVNSATSPGAGTAFFRDNGCTELGGVLTGGAIAAPTTPALASSCRFEFSNFNDLVNTEDHYQFFVQINSEVADGVKSHTEIAWSRDNVPEQRLSPANGNTQFPTPTSLGGTSGSLATPSAVNNIVRYNVPSYAPGLQQLIADCATSGLVFSGANNCASLATAGGAGGPGVDISQAAWRAISFGGDPAFADKADHQTIDNKAFRVSTGLQGEFYGIGWDTALTFMQARSDVSTNDLLVDRLQLALNGFGSALGGAPCSATTAATRTVANAGNAAMGCYFFNPFTNGIAVSAVNNQANPFYRGDVNPAVANNPQVVDWLYGNYKQEFQNEITVFDGVLNGKTGLQLPGGDLAWAYGVQYRHTRDRVDQGDLFNNKVTPCVDSIDDGTPGCNTPNGPFIFFGSGTNSDVSRNVYATFGELNIPILKSLNASLALRYEAYPGNIGSTTDPKLSIRWQALDWIALRASAGTTFRAPPTGTVVPGCATGVVNIAGTYRAQVTCGNPDLQPEKAKAYDFGLIFNPGSFTATLDYYYFDFTDELTTESATAMYAAMFPTATGHCGDPAYAALQARFNFGGGACLNTNVLGITQNNINGPETKTSGFDLRLQYDWHELMGGAVSVGLDGTYLRDYRRGDLFLNGAPNVKIQSAEDRAGKSELISQFFSYPKLKGNIFLSYTRGGLTGRLQTRYSEGTTHDASFGVPNSRLVFNGTSYSFVDLGKGADFWQTDLIVQWAAPWGVDLTASIQNVLDKDPPFTPSNYNYDYTNGNPLGRVFEVAFKKKF